MWAEQLSTWTGEARGEIGKIPIRKIIIRMHKGMLWMTLSMRKIFKMWMTKTTTFPGTLYFTAISTTRLSVIQSLLLSIVMNGMVRGGVVHGLFKMIQT
jgi:hypothetical protein